MIHRGNSPRRSYCLDMFCHDTFPLTLLTWNFEGHLIALGLKSLRLFRFWNNLF